MEEMMRKLLNKLEDEIKGLKIDLQQCLEDTKLHENISKNNNNDNSNNNSATDQKSLNEILKKIDFLTKKS